MHQAHIKLAVKHPKKGNLSEKIQISIT